MSGNLGREKMWDADVWGEIDKAVQAEVGRLRIAQKIFPTVSMPGAQFVPTDELNLETMTIPEGQTRPFVEISVEFGLTQSQVDNETTLRTARTLSRAAAKTVALQEDMLIFRGAGGALPNGVIRLINREAANRGLLGAAANAENPIHVPIGGQANNYGEQTFAAVTRGMSNLIAAAQPGPYALVLASDIYADTFAPMPQTLVTTADRITPLVTGGFYGTGTLPERTGLLVSLGGEPMSLYVSQDATTAFTQQDQNGNYRFRVFERIQFVARDRRAFMALNFAAP